MSLTRHCSKTVCANPAAVTLTYDYHDQTAVLGPLAVTPEPHTYDLCLEHSQRMSVPRGWEVVRLPIPDQQPEPCEDDLLALANLVRQAAVVTTPKPGERHLRSVPTPDF